MEVKQLFKAVHTYDASIAQALAQVEVRVNPQVQAQTQAQA